MITAILPGPVLPVRSPQSPYHAQPASRARPEVSPAESKRPDPSTYDDYRLLLLELYQVRKKKDRHFSYRFIAMRAGFKSVGFFSQIVHGNTDISQSTLLRLAQVFDLTGMDLERFEALVWWNQAKTPLERDHFRRRLDSLCRPPSNPAETQPSALHSRWYLPAIRELIACRPFSGDALSLGEAMVPKISAEQALEALQTLEDAGEIRRIGDRYESVETNAPGVDAGMGRDFARYHLAALELAKVGCRSVPELSRVQATLTLRLSETGVRRLREEIGEFRNRVMALTGRDQDPDRVCQVSLHAYPVTRALGD